MKLFIVLVLLLFLVGCSVSLNKKKGFVGGRGLADLSRFSDEIDAFTQQDMVSRYPSGMVVFVGSSSINMWHTLENDMSPHPVLNRGFGGSTIPEVNHYFHELVGKHKPAQVFLYCGENDLAMRYSVKETLDAFSQFLSLCEVHVPDAEIAYISLKPSPQRWSLRKKFAKVNAAIERLALSSSQFRHIDISSVMLDGEEQPNTSLFIEDQLHLNERGYEKWATQIKPVLDELRLIK